MSDLKYKCPHCWTLCTEAEMEADYLPFTDEDGYVDEVWSNHVCPGCGSWFGSVDEYEQLTIDQ